MLTWQLSTVTNVSCACAVVTHGVLGASHGVCTSYIQKCSSILQSHAFMYSIIYPEFCLGAKHISYPWTGFSLSVYTPSPTQLVGTYHNPSLLGRLFELFMYDTQKWIEPRLSSFVDMIQTLNSVKLTLSPFYVIVQLLPLIFQRHPEKYINNQLMCRLHVSQSTSALKQPAFIKCRTGCISHLICSLERMLPWHTHAPMQNLTNVSILFWWAT